MKKYFLYFFVMFKDILRIFKHWKWQLNKIRENPDLIVGKKLQKFKNSKQGKRCFIIGNGPSLMAKDLDKLIGEDCFAANGIWGIFEKTKWRPTYYFLGDPQYAEFIGDNILKPVKYSRESFFVFTHIDKYSAKLKNEKNVNYYCQGISTIMTAVGNKLIKNRFHIKGDITHSVKSCGTITFEMLQVAIYMGYSKIYLLGVDHNYSNSAHFNGCDQLNTDIKVDNFECWEKGYRTAKHLAEKKNIVIYNATRGGNLRIFEKVSFDNLKF